LPLEVQQRLDHHGPLSTTLQRNSVIEFRTDSPLIFFNLKENKLFGNNSLKRWLRC